MDIIKNNRINLLFTFYNELLTNKQSQYLKLYYVYDYSLSEIAENFCISRQAVYENICRTESILENYESKLHLLKKYQIQKKILFSLRKYILSSNCKEDKKLNKIIDELQDSIE